MRRLAAPHKPWKLPAATALALLLGSMNCADDEGGADEERDAVHQDGSERTEQDKGVADLIIVAADPVTGVIGTYSENGLTISFQAIRGPEVPVDIQQGDPEAPAFEIDARFLSGDGEPFSVMLGGHGFIDPTWERDTLRTWPRVPDSQRGREFLMARQVADLLARDVTRYPAVGEELAMLMGLGRIYDITDPQDDVASGFSPITRSNDYYHWFGIYKKPVYYMDVNPLWADHSATWTVSVSTSGNNVASRITCNHGACADWGSMSKHCSKVYYNRPLNLPYMSTCGTNQNSENYSSYSCCASGYTIKPFVTGHLCHDDTKFQRDIIAAWPTTIGYPQYCADKSVSYWAPSCN